MHTLMHDNSAARKIALFSLGNFCSVEECRQRCAFGVAMRVRWKNSLQTICGGGRDALEGEGHQRRPQRRLDRRLEEVAKAVGGGYCRLQMPLKLALGVRGTVAGHRLGALERGGCLPPFPMQWGGTSPPSIASLAPGPRPPQ